MDKITKEQFIIDWYPKFEHLPITDKGSKRIFTASVQRLINSVKEECAKIAENYNNFTYWTAVKKDVAKAIRDSKG